MFPIKNHSGNIIGFGGRTIDDSLPKYLNSKDSPFFNKSRELYGFNNAKQDHKSDYFIVTEGYMDVIMLSQHDVNNAVARSVSCGGFKANKISRALCFSSSVPKIYNFKLNQTCSCTPERL